VQGSVIVDPNWTRDTQVSFPAGILADEATLQWVGTIERNGVSLGGFITDITPFHPEDISWPDQPGDRGIVAIGDRQIAVVDSITLAATRNGPLPKVQDFRPKRGDPSSCFLVFHQTDESELARIAKIGQKVALTVDRQRRSNLSAVHTAAHLMALALNAVSSQLWTKPAKLDSLGHPNFDQMFIKSSTIGENASRDIYRLGRSARKAGFNAEQMLAELDQTAQAMMERVNDWVSTDAAVSINPEIADLTAARTWRCALPEGDATIPCGGTHVHHLSVVRKVSIGIVRGEDQAELEVQTALQGAALQTSRSSA
jgi:alanyl-tRNA synthetase